MEVLIPVAFFTLAWEIGYIFEDGLRANIRDFIQWNKDMFPCSIKTFIKECIWK